MPQFGELKRANALDPKRYGSGDRWRRRNLLVHVGMSAAVPQGGPEGVLFCHAAGWRGEAGRWWGGRGAGEVTLAAIRGQPPRSSIFRLDSVLSAGALVLLNTSSGGTRGGGSIVDAGRSLCTHVEVKLMSADLTRRRLLAVSPQRNKATPRKPTEV